MPTSFSDIKLAVTTPMANEEGNAVQFVKDVLAACSKQNFKSITAYVILDSVSKDQTRALLEEFAKNEPRLAVIWAPENRGIVDAYIRGYREALAGGNDWILEIDAGYSHRPEDIPKFFETMIQGYDAVFGSRFMKGGRMFNTSWKRRMISQGGTVLSNVMLGTRLKDMTSGFELFSRQTLTRILERGITSRGPFFQTEIKFYCKNLKIAEVPIQYESDTKPAGKKALNDAFGNLWRLRKEQPLTV
jgi:dolichol-phosphate mannosyltransferase